MKKLYKQQHGSVMMEYVILLFFCAILVYIFWHELIFDMEAKTLQSGTKTVYLVNFDGDQQNLQGQQVESVGKHIQGFFQRLTAGIVLPVP